VALAPGTRLGPYEVIALIGAGGMGEVYRAHDTKLDRDVALKILPDTFSADPDRLARFRREAQVLAALNHPNIAAIHGFEDSDDRHALVLELVEGPTLADRIVKGPISLDEALPIAKQIAEAIEAAHEQGIVHRDLKPANIKVRDDGSVKVLDFGLAKALEPATAISPALTVAPTITTPAQMTGIGMLLGTAAYMSPEQAKGRPADKRSDVWAFGCVVYEMLTGKRAFESEDVSETLAFVLTKPPAWDAVPQTTPKAVLTLLRRCLEKDRKRRLPDIGAARLEIDDAVNISGPQEMVPARVSHRRRHLVLAAVGGGIVAAALAALAGWFLRVPVAARVTRLTIGTSGTAALSLSGADRDVAMTSDGSRVVYVGDNGAKLFVRALDSLESVAIASGQIRGPFVSPDGQWVGFIDGITVMKRVPISGGPAITIATLNGPSRGATWLPDNTIVFATSTPIGLQRISADGGAPTVLTRPDRAHGEQMHVWPRALPDGRHVLFTITPAGALEAAQVAALDLRTNAVTILVRGGSDAQYVASGHLLYVAGDVLRALPFDVDHLSIHEPAAAITARVVIVPQGGADVATSSDGTLVYVDSPGGGYLAARTLVWVDRSGHEEPTGAPPRAYLYPKLSPDGSRIAVFSNDEAQDVWIWDQRGTLTRLTSDPGFDLDPVWTPDGRRIIFGSDRGGGVRNLWWQLADGTGVAERLTTSDQLQRPSSVSPDGNSLVFEEQQGGRIDLMRVPLTGNRTPTSLLQTTFANRNGVISPNGRWLAYESNDTGRSEIYVRPYPNTGDGHSQVSTMGGTRPLWAQSGTELFFMTVQGVLMRVPVETGSKWNAGQPTKLFAGPYLSGAANPHWTYDVSPNGQRFLMIKTSGGDPNVPSGLGLVVVQHMDTELKRLAPIK
jgi:serine/threonine-protein kinase